ncbi:ABC transporter substrate-binding protein [Usitatibacter palustris]|uniref:Heme-binding protein A n=1 Tax=Usitatibacter palustris TaxID=2732487 RepID=A0A6M4H993_9PROT|nr:ABC transporter substrate-binding protein [Usitatibacter palustris]QJR16150.1 Heme-binding protein A [Usitatibacter palustris]
MRRPFCLVASLLIAVVPLANAKTLRWSSQGDYLTADPMAQNEILTNSINGHVYEGLLTRGKKLELLPALAVSWKQVSPTVWVFNLRKGVKWHDGSDFTADDVVFSIKRNQGPSSNFRVYGNAAGEPKKIDDHTVELTTKVPNPVMLQMLSNSVFIMNKAWCEKHKVEKSQDFTKQEESYAARNAMGTGPYVLVSRDPDVKSVFKKNPNWWGLKEKGYWDGNVDDIIYTPVKEPGTRMAALLAGNLDFVLDPSVQDVEKLKKDKDVKVYEGKENRIVFMGFDQARDELLYSNVKGKNPFKDKRVRQAFYQAIDVDAIHKTVMRGLSAPTAVNLPNPTIMGIPASMDKRYPYDVAAAKKLLTEAGYPNGFDLTIDCPNNRYINDEKICVAIAGMLAKIGVNAKVNAIPRSQYFPKAQRLEVSMYMLGWGGATTDAWFTLQPVLHSRNDKGDGDYNWGNYKDPVFDAMIEDITGDMDAKRRQETIIKAMKYHHDNIFHIPLHVQVIPWASRANVTVIHRADNWLQATWVTIK